MSKAPDYYKVLNVDPKASMEVIKAAYHVLSKIHHEDKDDDLMKRINAAGEVLLDKDRRKTYDAKLFNRDGKIIGEYKVLEKIAEGGFGTTYKAEHLTLGTQVCIKHAHEVGPEDEALLLEEARIIWDLRHFSIPAIRDILRMPDGSLALVMSYIPGPTLTQVIEKMEDGIEPEHVAWITQRILNVLKYLHYHGVVHGDVKPQNVIIQPENHTVVLVDYGLSTLRPNRKSEAKGYTPYFAAPEQKEGKPPIAQMDLYGLGMTMIYALGGDVEHVKVPGHTPDAMCGFIKDLIRLDPNRRPDVWQKVDLCDTIEEVRKADFGRSASAMKPFKLP